jgi:hypothetical protein
MGGALLQLALNQVPDYHVILTNKPDISFFNIKYSQYTNFSRDQIYSETKIINPTCCQDLSFKINPVGDILYKTYVVVEIPQLIITQPIPDVKTVKSILTKNNIKWNTDKQNTDLINIDDLNDTNERSINFAIQNNIASNVNTINIYSSVIDTFNNPSIMDKYQLIDLTQQEFYMLALCDALLNSHECSNIGVNLDIILHYYLDTKTYSDSSLADIIVMFLDCYKSEMNIDDNMKTLLEIDNIFQYDNIEYFALMANMTNSDVYFVYQKYYNECSTYDYFRNSFHNKLQQEFDINKTALNSIIDNYNTFKFDIHLILRNGAFIANDISINKNNSSYFIDSVNKEIDLFKMNIINNFNSYVNILSNKTFNLSDILSNILDFIHDVYHITVDNLDDILNNINLCHYNSNLVDDSSYCVLSMQKTFEDKYILEWIINVLSNNLNINTNILYCFINGSDIIQICRKNNIYITKNYNSDVSSAYHKLTVLYTNSLNNLMTNLLSQAFFNNGCSTFYRPVYLTHPIPKTEEVNYNLFTYKKIPNMSIQQIITKLNPITSYNSYNDVIFDLNKLYNSNIIINQPVIMNLRNSKDLLLQTLTNKNFGTNLAKFNDMITYTNIYSCDLIYSEIDNIDNIDINFNNTMLLALFNIIATRNFQIDKTLLYSNNIADTINNHKDDLVRTLHKQYTNHFTVKQHQFYYKNNKSDTEIHKHIKDVILQQSIVYNWVNELGNRIIKNINFLIDGNIIFSLSNFLLHINYHLFSFKNQQRGYNEMIGNTDAMKSPLAHKPITELFIPIPWYNDNGIPLISLLKSKILINLTTESLNNLLVINPLFKLSNPTFKIRLLNEYVYLDKSERDYFLSNPLKQLITKYENNGKYVFNKIRNPVNIKLNINNATKYLIWYIKIIDNENPDVQNWNTFGDSLINPIISNMVIRLNNQEIFSPLSESYFTNVQPYKQRHSLNKGEYLYSFSLDMSLYQPSGACNLSLFEQCEIGINFTNQVVSKINDRYNLIFELWGNTYNTLSIQDGYGVLLFC